MTHLDPDRLADRALGTDDPLTSMRRIGCSGALAVMRESPQLGCRR